MLAAILVFAAYLCGAVPYGLLIGLARGVDIRQTGSRNIGATNLARALGKRWGMLAMLLDMFKGLGPVLLAQHLLAGQPDEQLWLAGVMLAPVLGHVFPVFLRFRGGKGVATGLGVMLAACPLAGAVGLAIYVGCYALFRISSVGSLVGSAAGTLVMFLLETPLLPSLAALAITVLIYLRHLPNIRRLLRGEEERV